MQNLALNMKYLHPPRAELAVTAVTHSELTLTSEKYDSSVSLGKYDMLSLERTINRGLLQDYLWGFQGIVITIEECIHVWPEEGLHLEGCY
jgi:hypothetical protein